jgi:hypothetical protein
MNEKSMTVLDEKLREMALTNWSQFVQMVGEKAVTAAKICMLRQNNHSYGEIQIRLNLTKDQVVYGCEKCDGK